MTMIASAGGKCVSVTVCVASAASSQVRTGVCVGVLGRCVGVPGRCVGVLDRCMDVLGRCVGRKRGISFIIYTSGEESQVCR